ncbi:MAG: IS200/IS605 family element transposase accessory protein TnpB [Euryarchaeota archaeon]|nr:IS200/IS605 family element transposase accessory protein TnpB [Euryarchaeota archaeon]
MDLPDPKLWWLLEQFRLLVNRSIRIALREDIRSRFRLAKVAYRTLSAEHEVYKQYIPSAFEVALGVLKNYRRRARQGKRTNVPYLRNPLLKAENQSYRLDRETGRLRTPIRGTEGVQLTLPLSAWHRSILQDPSWGLGSLTVTSDRVIIVVRKEAPAPYVPVAAIALDTNETSLDGVAVQEGEARLVSVHFPAVRVVQATHFRRRRRLARKKANDRRVMRCLLRREGRREHDRINQRLHRVSKRLVAAARDRCAALVLEDLRMPRGGGHGRRMRRRLSSWPQGELHRQIAYKALALGVPVIRVNPAWTSKTCPACGARRRDRVGQDFVCVVCDWEMDRQHNAGLNILKTALASDEALARAVRFRPGALRRDVVIPRYDLLAVPAGAREEPSGAESLAGAA